MRRLIHKFIVWYTVKSAGGVFHHGPYGNEGIYVNAMTDEEYGRYQKWCVEREFNEWLKTGR